MVQQTLMSGKAWLTHTRDMRAAGIKTPYKECLQVHCEWICQYMCPWTKNASTRCRVLSANMLASFCGTCNIHLFQGCASGKAIVFLCVSDFFPPGYSHQCSLRGSQAKPYVLVCNSSGDEIMNVLTCYSGLACYLCVFCGCLVWKPAIVKPAVQSHEHVYLTPDGLHLTQT